MDEFIFNFFIERHIVLKETWLSRVLMFIHEKFPNITDLTQLANMVFEQWKYSDLADTSYAVFEQLSIKTDVVKISLNRPFVVQIVSLVDIGSPFHAQLTKLTYEFVDNSGFEALPENEKNNCWEVKPRRMLLLEVNDGEKILRAIEHHCIPRLSLLTKPGCKILLIPPLLCRRGTLLLKPKNCQVIGGDVETLMKSGRPVEVMALKLNKSIPTKKHVSPKSENSVIHETRERLVDQSTENTLTTMHTSFKRVGINTSQGKNDRASELTINKSLIRTSNSILSDDDFEDLPATQPIYYDSADAHKEEVIEDSDDESLKISALNDLSDVKGSNISKKMRKVVISNSHSPVLTLHNKQTPERKHIPQRNLSNSHAVHGVSPPIASSERNSSGSNSTINDFVDIKSGEKPPVVGTDIGRYREPWEMLAAPPGLILINEPVSPTAISCLTDLRNSRKRSSTNRNNDEKYKDAITTTNVSKHDSFACAPSSCDPRPRPPKHIHQGLGIQKFLQKCTSSPPSKKQNSRKCGSVTEVKVEVIDLDSDEDVKPTIVNKSASEKSDCEEFISNKCSDVADDLVAKFKSISTIRLLDAKKQMKFAVGSNRKIVQAVVTDVTESLRVVDGMWTMKVVLQDESLDGISCLVDHATLLGLIGLTPEEAMAIRSSSDISRRQDGQRRLAAVEHQLSRLDLLIELEMFSQGRAESVIRGIQTLGQVLGLL